MRPFKLCLVIVLWFVQIGSMHSAEAAESSNEVQSLAAFRKQLWQRDFSSLWLDKQLPAFDEDMARVRPEPIGYRGPYFQRFYIHFSEVVRSDKAEQQYQVQGKTKFKGRIHDFTGTFTIRSINCGPELQFGTGEYLTVMDEIVGNNKLRFGTISGIYELKENPQQEQSGVLRGTFMVDFWVNEQGVIAYNHLSSYSDSYCNNQFEGTWIPHVWDGYTGSRQHASVCNWGDFRIPCSLGLDIGAGEFSPSEEFLAYGWKSYGTEREEWWK